MKDMRVNVTVTIDAVDLLLGKFDLCDIVKTAIYGCDQWQDDIINSVADVFNANCDIELVDESQQAVYDANIETVVKHLEVHAELAQFDYEESDYLEDRSEIPYRIPCTINAKNLFIELLGGEWFVKASEKGAFAA